MRQGRLELVNPGFVKCGELLGGDRIIIGLTK